VSVNDTTVRMRVPSTVLMCQPRVAMSAWPTPTPPSPLIVFGAPHACLVLTLTEHHAPVLTLILPGPRPCPPTWRWRTSVCPGEGWEAALAWGLQPASACATGSTTSATCCPCGPPTTCRRQPRPRHTRLRSGRERQLGRQSSRGADSCGSRWVVVVWLRSAANGHAWEGHPRLGPLPGHGPLLGGVSGQVAAADNSASVPPATIRHA
jgi:hypothetical protein